MRDVEAPGRSVDTTKLERDSMSIGLRQLLLLAATVFFILALVNKGNIDDWLPLGLACMAGSALVKEMGWDRMLSSAQGSSG
jgi:hypothetical protein